MGNLCTNGEYIYGWGIYILMGKLEYVGTYTFILPCITMHKYMKHLWKLEYVGTYLHTTVYYHV